MNQRQQNCIANSPRRSQRQRDGYLYVAVLFTSLVVLTAATTAFSISTSTLRSENDRTNQDDALWLAESEMQRQLAIIKSSGTWRNKHTNDTFVDWHSLKLDEVSWSDESSVRHKFYDSDGDLADDNFDSVRLTVHARSATSHAAVSVELEPDPIPLDLLRYSITTGDDLKIPTIDSVVTERAVQVSDNTTGSPESLLTTPQLHCSGRVEISVRGEQKTASVTMPPHDVVDRYISLGTEIPNAEIPRSSRDLLLANRLLTKKDNPFGPVDKAGIYWIDAGGARVIIKNCRLEATLAITNSANVRIHNGVVWRYPNQADVILATNTILTLSNITPTLDENTVGVNFNPTSSPYRGTESNLTAKDVYPTELTGILYTSGNMRINRRTDGRTLKITGSLISRDLHLNGSVSLHSLDEVLTFPPPGLSDPTPMRLIRSSFRRIPPPQ
ncbi:MAG: hypothetical protein P8L85_23800 [Rubripirellula sp.]|nr:hypothetical protein [Rubripirellula sp.]